MGVAGVSLPYDMEVTTSMERIYEGQEVTADDVSVVTKSLFGVTHSVDDFKLENQSDDKSVVITVGHLSKTVEFNKIPVSYLTAEAVAKYYQYEKAMVYDGDLDVQAVYKDGTTTALSFSDYIVDNIPDIWEEDTTLKISTKSDSVNLVVRPVEVVSLDASYEDGLHVGDTFDMKKVSCTVTFEDGTVNDVTDISSEFSGEIGVDSEVKIVSEKYGETTLTIDKSNVTGYDVKYDDKIYEGDELDVSKLHITVMFEDDSSKELTDLTLESTRVFEATPIQVTSESFGTMKCTITPVAVKSIVAQASVNSENQITFSALQFVYEDNTARDLNMDDVEFVTDLSVPIQLGENTIVFEYFGHEYSFVEKLVN